MNETRRTIPERSFPDVRTAFLLTIGAIFAGGLVGLLFIDLGLIAAEGLGTALGVGGVATLAARRVAEPQGLRIGLTALDWRAVPLIFCLAPAVLLASELDNFAYDWTPAESVQKAESEKEESRETEASQTDRATTASRPGPVPEAKPATGLPRKPPAEENPEPILDPNDPFNVMEGFIVSVGIAPVIHEFLFRGVVQQGLVGQLGHARGVTLTALLWTMLRPVPSASPTRFAAAFVSWFAMGWLLGMVRTATGSILGPILLSSLWSAVGFASVALDGRLAVPGINVDGTHLPPAVTLLSAVVVGLSARHVREIARRVAPETGMRR